MGRGTGNGTFAGRGCKGQNSRAGGGVRIGFEGGQSGFLAHIPKLRGFKNPNKITAQVINLSDLSATFSDNDVIELKSLLQKKLITKKNAKVKILGYGEITIKISISSELLISESAKKSIIKAGGKILAK